MQKKADLVFESYTPAEMGCCPGTMNDPMRMKSDVRILMIVGGVWKVVAYRMPFSSRAPAT